MSRITPRRLLCLVLLTAYLLSLCGLTAVAESYTAEVKVQSMVVRTGPATSYPVLTYLAKGTKVTVQSTSNGIALISFDGKSGYAFSGDLQRIDGNKSGESISGMATVTASSAKVYTSPDTSSKVMILTRST